MKFRCTCDAVICDQTDSLPYKAWLLPDESCDEFYSGTSESIAAYIDAIVGGTENQWLNENLSEEYTKLGLSRISIIHDLLAATHIRLKRPMYLCDKCGRLLVSHPQDKHFRAYSPDDSPVPTDILRQASDNTPT